MEYLIIIGILVLAITIYFIAYRANKKTQIPEGLEERYQEAQTCSGCHAKQKMLVPEEVLLEYREENNL